MQVVQQQVVEQLLGRDDVLADTRDVFGRTPLSHAAEYDSMVTLSLLKRDDVVDTIITYCREGFLNGAGSAGAGRCRGRLYRRCGSNTSCRVSCLGWSQ